MHQFIHLKLAQKIFRKLVRYHIYHHCKYPNSCFGISVPWWDDLFNTVPPAPKITQRIIDFYFNGYPQAQSYSLVRVATEMNWTNNCHHNCRTCSADLENCNLNSWKKMIILITMPKKISIEILFSILYCKTNNISRSMKPFIHQKLLLWKEKFCSAL